MCVIVHLYINACPVEWRLPWLSSLVISGLWRLPLRLISPTLMTLSFTSDGDVTTSSQLSSSDWPDWYSYSGIWGREKTILGLFLSVFLFLFSGCTLNVDSEAPSPAVGCLFCSVLSWPPQEKWGLEEARGGAWYQSAPPLEEVQSLIRKRRYYIQAGLL